MKINAQYRCPGCMRLLNGENDICECGYISSTSNKYTHRLKEGTILADNYVIGKVIGEGGFGITYVGWDIELEMKVAIKEFYLKGYATRNCTVSDEITSSSGENGKLYDGYRDKFSNEAKTLARFMSEPGIVSVYRHFRENNTAYIVMEFLEGETLQELLHREGKISVQNTIGVLRPVMTSLSKIHEKNLIHRDISPDNIIITVDGYGKLLDFGSARDYSDGNNSLSVVLKHGYAPAEQYQSHGKQGPWTDVYAMSATIYRCITGEKPTEAVERAVGAELLSPLEKGANCSEAFNDIIMKALSISVEDRYQTMGEFAKELIGAVGRRDVPSSPEVENRTVIADDIKKAEQISERQRIRQEKEQSLIKQEQLMERRTKANEQLANSQVPNQPNSVVLNRSNSQVPNQPNSVVLNRSNSQVPNQPNSIALNQPNHQAYKSTKDTHIKELISPDISENEARIHQATKGKTKHKKSTKKISEEKRNAQIQDNNRKANGVMIVLELILLVFMFVVVTMRVNLMNMLINLGILAILFSVIIALAADISRRDVKYGSAMTLIGGVTTFVGSGILLHFSILASTVFSVFIIISIGICVFSGKE